MRFDSAWVATCQTKLKTEYFHRDFEDQLAKTEETSKNRDYKYMESSVHSNEKLRVSYIVIIFFFLFFFIYTFSFISIDHHSNLPKTPRERMGHLLQSPEAA